MTITGPEFYTSGDTFPISVTVSDPDARRWGFELSARILNSPPPGQQAGNLIPGTDGFSTLLSSSNNIQYIGHTAFGTRSGTTGSISFDFIWQAPDVSAGPVIFHAVGDGSNGSFSPTGDRIYSTSATSQPQQISGQPPAVPDGGVVDGASFALHPNPLAPGAIVSIFGTDLTDGSDGSFTFFDSNGRLATTLAGAQVTFNGIAASLFAAFPGQLNVQIPTELTDVSTATVEVTVNGQTSTPRTIFIDPVSPGIFTVSSSGSGAGAILHADGSLITSQKPAAPGEVIIIFCTGLGEVKPEVGTGFPATGLHTTVETPTVTIDGLDAVVQFSGLAPTFVGLYQVNAVVPPEGVGMANDIPIVLTIGGRQSNPNKTVTIAVAETGGTSSGGGGGTAPPVDGGTEDDLLDDDDDDPLDDGY
ncbi:MAG: hypothetical protein O7E51_01005 [Acidobacteria bacterium]|nr:hypothetical protein [Acidobacteriota bacterium]